MDIPIVIIAYNNYTFVKNFVNQIKNITNKVIIFDNASTYPPQLEYYNELEKEDKDKYEICRFTENHGHNVCYKFIDTLPDVFCMSDPDLLLNPQMPINVAEHLLAISEKFGSGKVGLALDISDHHLFIKENNYGGLVYNIESQYYSPEKKILEDPYELYIAGIDTTFCLINKKYDISMSHFKNIRVGGVFTAKHLPWYDNFLKNNIPEDELNHWKKNNSGSSILNYIKL
jgi:hypothetical protein